MTVFVVVADRDVVILRTLAPPSLAEFDRLIATARQTARQAGMKKSDVNAAVAKVRGRRAAKRSDG